MSEENAPRGAPATELLDGYDSISGERRDPALTASPSDGGGTMTFAHISVCEGRSALTQALDIDQSLAIEFGDSVKIDEKVKFFRKQEATSETVSIVVHARHQSRRRVTAKPPTLIKALEPSGLAAFVKHHGDSYVDSVTFGGEYYAVYTFHTQTSQEQKKLTGELSAKGIRKGASVDVKVVAALEEFAQSSSISSTFDVRLSGVDEELPDHAGMVEFVRKFPTKDFTKSAVVIDRSIARYENVTDFPSDAFLPVVRNRDYFVGSGQRSLARSLLEIGARTNKVDFIQPIHTCYGYDDKPLEQYKKALEADREAIRQQLKAYGENPLQTFTAPPLPSLDRPAPALRYESGSQSWGKKVGPNVTDFPSVESVLQSQTRLVGVTLWGSNYADKILMNYRNAGGEYERSIGGAGGGGIRHNKLSFGSDEFVKEVNARHGDIVDELEIVTTRNNRTKVGGLGGVFRPFKAEDGQVVLGFGGTGGVDIQTLQVFWAKLLPSLP